MKLAFAAAIALITLTTGAFADWDHHHHHHMVKVCKIVHHHQVCHMVSR